MEATGQIGRERAVANFTWARRFFLYLYMTIVVRAYGH